MKGGFYVGPRRQLAQFVTGLSALCVTFGP